MSLKKMSLAQYRSDTCPKVIHYLLFSLAWKAYCVHFIFLKNIHNIYVLKTAEEKEFLKPVKHYNNHI